MTPISDLDRCARALAEQQGIDWADLPNTDEEASRFRSPGCCNKLDSKAEYIEAVLTVLNAAGLV